MKPTKNEIKEITELAAKLPVSYYEATASCFATGEQLLKEGVTIFEGKPIELKKDYHMKEGMLFPVNHKRQLIKAFELNGKAGIIDYLKGQNEIHRPKPLTSFPSVQI